MKTTSLFLDKTTSLFLDLVVLSKNEVKHQRVLVSTSHTTQTHSSDTFICIYTFIEVEYLSTVYVATLRMAATGALSGRHLARNSTLPP